jgi:heme/copper-type cytochrome/quinol oxidase subunit 2
MWRLNIADFIFGAVPQVIKIFSMRGIPWMQMLVAFSISSFVVTETFRAIAGPAGAVNLHPMPVVFNVKKALSHFEFGILLVTCAISWTFLGACLGALLFFREEGSEHARFRKEVALPLGSIGLALSVTLAVAFASSRLAGFAKCTRLGTKFTPSGQSVEKATQLRSRLIVTLAAIFALTHHHVESYLAPSILFMVILATSTLSMAFLPSQFWHTPYHGPTIPVVIAAVGLFVPIFILTLHFIFRVAIMGSLSKYPRQTLGFEGLVSEFIPSVFFLVNLLSAFIDYSYLWYDPEGTYKPTWADQLG